LVPSAEEVETDTQEVNSCMQGIKLSRVSGIGSYLEEAICFFFGVCLVGLVAEYQAEDSSAE